ncbi:hypothetical protein ACFSCX_21440 [Bacillus salitolerans]|uniref:Uncharacterized protein n=1 Tax=Bacillus salitolerans TaxID=1437434 RepID=A0ABW4LXC7_9BACI
MTRTEMRDTYPIEMLLWSIALPGFAQILNKHYIKGILFIILEFLINVQGHLNEAIVYSFQGDTQQAISIVDYQWIMFYPCLYVFAMWDAYKSAKEKLHIKRNPFESIPFSIAAYITTVGVIFSSKPIFSITFGPIFTPIISVIIGFLIGNFVRKLLLAILHTRSDKEYT